LKPDSAKAKNKDINFKKYIKASISHIQVNTSRKPYSDSNSAKSFVYIEERDVLDLRT